MRDLAGGEGCSEDTIQIEPILTIITVGPSDLTDAKAHDFTATSVGIDHPVLSISVLSIISHMEALRNKFSIFRDIVLCQVIKE